jgi:hypothetical protein
LHDRTMEYNSFVQLLMTEQLTSSCLQDKTTLTQLAGLLAWAEKLHKEYKRVMDVGGMSMALEENAVFGDPSHSRNIVDRKWDRSFSDYSEVRGRFIFQIDPH